MKTSPCWPLILQRWTLPLLVQNAPCETSERGALEAPCPAVKCRLKEVAESNFCKFLAGNKIINYLTIINHNTKVVAIPNDSNSHSIITALTAKGEEWQQWTQQIHPYQL